MMIFHEKDVRVLQHEHLTFFHVQVLMEGDNPRSYGRNIDYRTVLETNSLDLVKKKVRELLDPKKVEVREKQREAFSESEALDW